MNSTLKNISLASNLHNFKCRRQLEYDMVHAKITSLEELTINNSSAPAYHSYKDYNNCGKIKWLKQPTNITCIPPKFQCSKYIFSEGILTDGTSSLPIIIVHNFLNTQENIVYKLDNVSLRFNSVYHQHLATTQLTIATPYLFLSFIILLVVTK